jgi:LysM repeat protein
MPASSPFFGVLGLVGLLTIGHGVVVRPPDAAGPGPAPITASGNGSAAGALSLPAASADPGASPTEDAAPAAASPVVASAVGLPVAPPSLSRYVVRAGDTVNAIAAQHGISPRTIAWANNLANPNLIRPGQTLQIPSVDGTIHHVREGDTASAVAEAYDAPLQEVLWANRLAEGDALRGDSVLIVPNAARSRPEVVGPAPASVHAIGTPSEQAFIASIVRPAQDSQRVTGIPASVTIAQAILETYWGTSFLAREANNYFGIKAHRRGGTEGVVWIDAWEVENGKNVVRQEPFRKYSSVTDSLVDHGRFFHENSRYARALEAKDDAREFARRINAAGYATDPAYASKLIALMDRFALFDYDVR